MAWLRNGFRYARAFATLEPRGLHWSGGLLFIPSVFTCGLGYWQIQRRQWKVSWVLLSDQSVVLQEDLLQRREAKIFSKGFSLFDHISKIELYDRVQVEGVFMDQQSVFIGPRSRT